MIFVDDFSSACKASRGSQGSPGSGRNYDGSGGGWWRWGVGGKEEDGEEEGEP